MGPPMKNGPEAAVRFIAASFSRCACTSCSDIPAPMPSGGRNTSFGFSAKSWSTLFTPMRASIAARSSSVCGEYGLAAMSDASGPHRLADVRAVVLGGEELLQLTLVGELHFQHPTVFVWLLIHELWFLDDLHVALENLAGDGAVDVRRGLHRLDHAETGELPDGRALLGKLDEHDVTELLLRELRDPDRRDIAVEAHPLVLLRIAQFLRDGHLSPLL